MQSWIPTGLLVAAALAIAVEPAAAQQLAANASYEARFEAYTKARRAYEAQASA